MGELKVPPQLESTGWRRSTGESVSQEVLSAIDSSLITNTGIEAVQQSSSLAEDSAKAAVAMEPTGTSCSDDLDADEL
jgi:hypothetical protein